MEKPIRILHLVQNHADALLIQKQFDKLTGDFNLQTVTSRADYTHALQTFRPDIILIDDSLTDLCAVEARVISKQLGTEGLLILVTELSRFDAATELMYKGIDDFILRDRINTFPVVIRKAVERRLAEVTRQEYLDRLKGQEQKFRALLENSYEAISLMDKNLKITYRTASIERVSGYTLKELENISLFNYIHPDDEAMVKEIFKAALHTEKVPFRGTFRAQHKNGNYIWLDTTVTNLLNDENVQAIVVNYRDITENKNYETQLLHTGNYFKALLENISDAIILIDATGTILYVSPSVKHTIGFVTDEMAGHNLFEFIHDNDVNKGRDFLKEVLINPHTPIRNTYRVKHKKGNYIWVSGTFTNMLAENSVRGIIINFHDITRRRRSQRLLRKSEANLRAVFENTRISYVLVDRQYRVISFNGPAKERYKPAVEVELTEGMNIIEAMPADRRAENRAHFEQVLSGKRVKYERRFIHPDGKALWYQVDLLPVHDNYGAVLGLLISSEDITERKNADLEKEKMTADIIQHNKNLEQFAYIISHNLRSPVANIIGLAGLINNSSHLSENDFKKCVEGLLTTANKLDEIISDLNYILHKRREVRESMEIISFTTLVSDIRALLDELIKKEKATIKTNFDLDRILTVRSYLHSVFTNLITNSIKYRKPDIKPVISISTKKEGPNACIIFRDNGLGIDLNAHGDKLFGLYKKFHPHIEGKGMGLYMVKSQVAMLGGTIEIDSIENKGVQFTIRIPVPDLLPKE
jgi:PAS domain S-box-containing protein